MFTWNGLCRGQRKRLNDPLLLAIVKVKFKRAGIAQQEKTWPNP